MDNLSRALEFTLFWEGGYVNNPNDPGGATKWGISQRAFPHLDIENLTIEQAKQIYKERYWEPTNGDDRPFHEALAVFDFAVHSGVSRALTYWARAKDVEDYLANRMDFLASLESFNDFGRGWMRRVIALTRAVDAELAEQARSPDVELIQLFHLNHTYEFRPIRTTLGTTNSGRVKVMARLE